MRSLVPLFTLMVDLLNYEMYYLDICLVKYCYANLLEVFSSSEKSINNLLQNPLYANVQIIKETDNENLVVCEICYDELFNYWAYGEKFLRKDKYDAIMCLSCFEREFKSLDFKYRVFLAYKYSIHDLKKLFERVKKRIDIEENNIETYNLKTDFENSTEDKIYYELEDEFQANLAKANKDTRFNNRLKAEFIDNNKTDEKLIPFLNSKNPIFKKIKAMKILNHVKNNFMQICNKDIRRVNIFTSQINEISNEKLLAKLLGKKYKKHKSLYKRDNDNCILKNKININEKVKEEHKNDIFAAVVPEDNNDIINESSSNASVYEFLEKTNLKLINFKYDSKIIIPKSIENVKSEENQFSHIDEAQRKVSNEINDFTSIKKRDEDTITHSANHIEQELLHHCFEELHTMNNNLLDKTLDKLPILTEKMIKEGGDNIEVNLSSYEISNEQLLIKNNVINKNYKNNNKNKYLISINNIDENLQLSKMTTNDFIRYFDKYAVCATVSNNFINNGEFTYNNQRKKLKAMKKALRESKNNQSKVEQNTNHNLNCSKIESQSSNLNASVNHNTNPKTLYDQGFVLELQENNKVKDEIGETVKNFN